MRSNLALIGQEAAIPRVLVPGSLQGDRARRVGTRSRPAAGTSVQAPYHPLQPLQGFRGPPSAVRDLPSSSSVVGGYYPSPTHPCSHTACGPVPADRHHEPAVTAARDTRDMYI